MAPEPAQAREYLEAVPGLTAARIRPDRYSRTAYAFVKKRRFLLVITCRYSNLVRVVPLVKITALTVAKAFCTHWVFPYGPPSERISENGSQFTAKVFQAVCRHLGVKKKFTTPYHPQANGACRTTQ